MTEIRTDKRRILQRQMLSVMRLNEAGIRPTRLELSIIVGILLASAMVVMDVWLGGMGL